MSSMSGRLLVAGVVAGLAALAWGNGGPFVVKYPGGDPAAKGVLARLDPDLKPAREERLRVIKEDLKVMFVRDPLEESRRAAPPPANEGQPTPAPPPPLPPLAIVIAAYTIENPTDQAIEVDFGFPIVRGIYLSPFSMMPMPDARVTLGDNQLPVQIISNSVIYGLIRQKAREAIEKAIAADAELARRVARVRAAGYVRQRAREVVRRAVAGDAVAEQTVLADRSLTQLLAVGSDAEDPDRDDARKALLEYLTGPLKWRPEKAILLVEYASQDIGGPARLSPDWRSGFHAIRAYDDSLFSVQSGNLGTLGAIGEQKATQLFAELAGQFDPTASTAYEAIFSAWGGDVRERSIDIATGRLRPREVSLGAEGAKPPLGAADSDPTVYARVDYLDSAAGITDAERESCRTILKHLPVVFTFAPMNLLHYRVKFAPKKTEVLTVSYKQYAYIDTGEPASYQVAYVLHPASLWKEFGPIELEIATPENVDVRASAALDEASVEEREIPRDLHWRDANGRKQSMAVRRATLTDKTGELFIGINAEQWRRGGKDIKVSQAQPQPAAPVARR